MDREVAKEKFRLADRLFNEQQFAPALKVLTELNAAFPNERHVLYPMARCLTGMGRNSEALDLADRVVRQFNYAPAIELYKKLKSLKTGDGLAALESISDPVLPPGMPNLDSDPTIELPPGIPRFDSDPVVLPPGMPKFDSGPIELPGGIQKFDSDPPPLPKELGSMFSATPSRAAGAAAPVSASTNEKSGYLLWGALLFGGFFAAIALTITVGRPMLEFYADYFRNLEKYTENPGLLPAFPASSFLIVFCACYAYSFVLGCFSGYFSLRLIDALPYNSFGEDMKDAALYSLYCFLLSWIPILGWIAALVILKKHYELDFGKLVGAVLLYNVFATIFSLGFGFVGFIIVMMLSA